VAPEEKPVERKGKKGNVQRKGKKRRKREKLNVK
jgi:hypothetical protein